VNEFVPVGGDATSDNLPLRFSQIQYSEVLGQQRRGPPGAADPAAARGEE